MRLLLDTHTFLWFASGAGSLSRLAKRRIEDPRNEKFLSVASIWEMAIKLSLGKMKLSGELAQLVEIGAVANGIALLDVTRQHALAVAGLPRLAGDPFDRLLVAQATVERLAIVGRDEAFDAYPVRRVW